MERADNSLPATGKGVRRPAGSSGKETYTFCGEGEERVEDTLRHLLESGYEGGVSIEPHLAHVIHAFLKGR